MEHIVRERTYPQSESYPPRMKWSLPLRIVFMVWIGFTTAMSLRTLAQSAVPFPDPFSAYADIFPGQPRSAAESRGLICHSIPYPAPAEATCRINLATGTFTSVGALISGGVIYEVNFTMRNYTFRIGDLMVSFGKPEIHPDSYTTYYAWPSKGVRATTSPSFSERFSLFLPVWSVSFTSL